MNVCGRICLLVIFIVSKFVSGSDDSSGGFMEIEFRRATTNSIVVEVICEPSCTDKITWDIKIDGEDSWTEIPPTSVRRVLDMYQLLGLEPAKTYDVQGRSTYSSKSLTAKTCPGHSVPGTGDLRSMTNGPGWLDIRWTPPDKLPCSADYEYLTRFRVEDGPFTPYGSYGFFPLDDKGHFRIGPSHPCPKWPKEFCLMITEGVVAGKNHTVEVVVKLLNGSREEAHSPQSLVAFADDLNEQGWRETGMHPECVIWACVAVGMSLFTIAVVVSILVSSVVHTIRKTNAYEREHGPPEGPFDFMEYLYNT